MKIDHIAMYVNDLEKAREFFMKYLSAVSNEGYHNKLQIFVPIFFPLMRGQELR